MKFTQVFMVFAIFLSLTFAADKYTTKYDDIDLDEILHNERLFTVYFNCLTNHGKCSPDGKELKDNLPDALATSCSKCSAKQKLGTDKVIKYLLQNKPNDYAVLEKLYDPQGSYKKRYQEQAGNLGIKV